MSNALFVNFEQFNPVGEKVTEAATRFNNLANNNLQKLLSLHGEIVSGAIEDNAKHLKSLSQAKKPDEYFSLQASYVADTGRKTVDATRKYVDFVLEANSQITDLVQSNLGNLNNKKPAKTD